MQFNEYSDKAYALAIYPRNDSITENLTYPVLGLNGEAGEVAEKLKKVIRDNRGVMTSEQQAEIIKELGDVLWYLNACAQEIGVSLNLVAQRNIEKLYSRKDRDKLQGSGDNR